RGINHCPREDVVVLSVFFTIEYAQSPLTQRGRSNYTHDTDRSSQQDQSDQESLEWLQQAAPEVR
ncbi:hypothetical protein O6449_23935, partial [Salmonella enterica subsp. enterica]